VWTLSKNSWYSFFEAQSPAEFAFVLSPTISCSTHKRERKKGERKGYKLKPACHELFSLRSKEDLDLKIYLERKHLAPPLSFLVYLRSSQKIEDCFIYFFFLFHVSPVGNLENDSESSAKVSSTGYKY
jgi:hypothetical protein